MTENQGLKRINLIILIIQVAIAISSLVITAYFTNENLQLSYSSRRADISLLANKNWEFSIENVTFFLSGEIVNEGSRKTVIQSIEIGVTFITSTKSKETYSNLIENPSAEFGWENSSLLESQSKQIEVYFETPMIWMSAVEDYRKPDEGWIEITHYDGVTIQNEMITFSRLSSKF